MTEKPAKPATEKPTSPRKPKTRPRKPNQGEISKRAYFIHLEEGEAMSSGTGCVRSAR
jgi:hypothetical protein